GAEEALREAHEESEKRVEDRTRELIRANEELRFEIAERQRAEHGLQESEERFRLLVEGVKDYAIFMLDTSGFIVSWNDGAERIKGYKSEEIIGKHISIFYSEEDVENSKPQHELDIAVIQGRCENEGWSVRKDGSKFWANMIITALRDEEGNLCGFSKITRDITERKRVEEALRKTRDELEIRVIERTTELINANERLQLELIERKRMEEELLKAQKLESIGVLAGGIAHDFNNLLTAILGNIYLTKMYTNPGDKGYKKLTEAEKACLRAKGLTQRLLTFSKGGAPVKKVTSIKELIKDSASFAVSGSDVRCEFHIEDGLWNVEVDEGQISQVINNVVINAEQAMPEGGVIRVRAENISRDELTSPLYYKGDGLPLKGERYVKVTIEDEGIGIPEEHLPKIFDPYFTTKQRGSGIGLTAVYSIIKKHDGYIAVESELGAGTKFYIYLPASEKETLAKVDIKEGPVASKGRILVMDDEEMIRGVAGGILNRIGYEVEFARDGKEAIELYKEAIESSRPFDVVIMDLTISGGMGGKEAIKRLLEIDPEVKAIVSSGYSNDPVMSDYKKYSFRGIVSKPFRIEELAQTLHEVINEK
ncbi:MAG: PAS domain S-box protein, partial [Ignavibacteriales bacterium]